MARYSSLRVGGPADVFISVRSAAQLSDAVDGAEDLGIPWRVIGSASNLLIADHGVEGLVVRAAWSSIGSAAVPAAAGQRPALPAGIQLLPADGGSVLARVEAGRMLAAVGKELGLAGLSGLEWAVNVPGTIGGAVVDNSGAFGSCVSEHLVEASIYTPGQGVRTFTADDLGLAYRTSRLKRSEPAGVVLEAAFRLILADPEGLRARIAEIQRTRRATQPSGYSLGSIFANPPMAPAGRLIEEAGLKGSRVGDAEVSRVHANFILNRGAARAEDVLHLMRRIQESVWGRTGIWLAPELQPLGRFEETILKDVFTRPVAPP